MGSQVAGADARVAGRQPAGVCRDAPRDGDGGANAAAAAAADDDDNINLARLLMQAITSTVVKATCLLQPIFRKY
jgi:hypothetical protein